MKFVECNECRTKPGSPVLCDSCLNNRDAIAAHTNQQDLLGANGVDIQREAIARLSGTELSVLQSTVEHLRRWLKVDEQVRRQIGSIVAAIHEAGGGWSHEKVAQMTVGKLLRELATNSVEVKVNFVGGKS